LALFPGWSAALQFHLNRKLTADLPHSSLAAREPIAINQQSPLDRASILAQAGTENQAAQTDTTMKQQFSLAPFREEERRQRCYCSADSQSRVLARLHAPARAVSLQRGALGADAEFRDGEQHGLLRDRALKISISIDPARSSPRGRS
jgi:hypothetical protein